MERALYIIAYDITEPVRLNRVRYFLKGYSTGGQKSVYECFLSQSELKFVISNLKRLIYEADDRVHIFRLDARSRTITLGIALQPKNPSFFFFG
ncbi:MAG: CRISPR-associated endonuclease Cas2 [Nitrospirae bacterium]|nr:MAG: CRISPR-associated endonuclease Cas2 [Nitrospirota bacterium]